MRILRFLLFCVTIPLLAQGPWVMLFDGKGMEGWRAPVTPGLEREAWRVEEGALRPVETGKDVDLWTVGEYRSFELEFEFKVDAGANGGIKYLVQSGVALRWRNGKGPPLLAVKSEALPGDLYSEGSEGLEYQIVDDAAPEAQDSKRSSGAMYALVAPDDPPAVGPGVFHKGRIVVRGDEVEHYLDGKRVVRIKLGSEEMEAAFDACKVGRVKRLRPLEKRVTPIAITHHGSAVWYRNVRVRELGE
jgi:hypothetical protein